MVEPRARPHQKREALGPKNESSEVLEWARVCRFVHAYACVPRNPNSDSFDGSTSNDHNSLN